VLEVLDSLNPQKSLLGAMGAEEARTRAVGADGFVVKPFDLVSLGDVIADILARGRPALEGLQRLNPSELPAESF
jgi:hypothetical protein